MREIFREAVFLWKTPLAAFLAIIFWAFLNWPAASSGLLSLIMASSRLVTVLTAVFLDLLRKERFSLCLTRFNADA